MTFIQINQISKSYTGGSQAAVQQFQLDLEQGEIITLLGPSGCGKTTTLRMLAGFEEPDSGSIQIGDQVVFDSTVSVPPEKRGIGMVFQDYALFPHLTIEKNVMFGLSKWKKREKTERVKEVLELVGLEDYGDRYPHQLSGGQQQRVALARAMAPRPHVVLMDEPFSNLDASLKERMRLDVMDILRRTKTTAIIVTHDQKDAFAVSDRVVVMKDGVIQQIATPRDMYRCPKNCFVAQFVGKTNLLTGNLAADMKHVFTHIGKVSLPVQTKDLLDQVTLSIRPEGCRLVEKGKYFGQVQKVTYSGEYQEVEVYCKTQSNSYESMIIYAPIEEDIDVGKIVSFDISPELVALVEQ